MADLLVRPGPTAADGTFLSITPDSAGWDFVGFEALALDRTRDAERDTGARELCVVVVQGAADVRSDHGSWLGIGGRLDPWAGMPDAVYLPPGAHLSLSVAAGAERCELGLCWAPAPSGGAPARLLSGSEVVVEIRGSAAYERTVRPILMGDREAESLLICEVLTPSGHWSSYPPHKHDRHDSPRETELEETYYHRLAPERGFGLQRVYSSDRSLDESLAFHDRDCVLVPRGYHTVSAPPGYELYYLNVMAGPQRRWQVTNDPDHAWVLEPTSGYPQSRSADGAWWQVAGGGGQVDERARERGEAVDVLGVGDDPQ